MITDIFPLQLKLRELIVPSLYKNILLVTDFLMKEVEDFLIDVGHIKAMHDGFEILMLFFGVRFVVKEAMRTDIHQDV